MSDHEHTYGDDGMCTNCGAPHEAMVMQTSQGPLVAPTREDIEQGYALIGGPLIPPHIVEAMHVAEAPGVSVEDKEAAVEVLRAWDAAHAEPSE